MAYNTIKIKKYSDVIEEFTAHETLTPGYLVAVNSDGEAALHAVAGGTVLPMFVLEDELQGKGIDDTIAANNPVQVWIPYRGDIVYAQLADGENVVKGDLLVSATGGKLAKLVAPDSTDDIVAPDCVVGVAVEAVDMTVSNDPSGRIKVRIK